MDWSQETIRSLGALLGVANCDATKLETRVAQLDSLTQDSFYNPSARNSYQGKLVDAYLSQSVPKGVASSSNSITAMRQRALKGLTPDEIIWYPYVVGPAASNGYYRVTDDDSPGAHYGMRNEWWNVGGVVGDEERTIVLSVHRFANVPSNLTQLPQNTWRVVMGVVENGAFLYNVYTIPGGTGIVHVTATPFHLTVGTEVEMLQVGNDLVQVKFFDPNNGNRVDLQMDFPFTAAESRVLNSYGGTGFNDNVTSTLAALGVVNGENVTGVLDFTHQWENGVFPQGFPSLYYMRSLQMFPQKYGNPWMPSRYISCTAKLKENGYHVSLLWLGSPTLDTAKDHEQGKKYCYVTSRGTAVPVYDFTVKTYDWVPAEDGYAYPTEIELDLPTYQATLTWALLNNQFINIGTDLVPIFFFMGGANVNGHFLGNTETNQRGFVNMTTRASRDEMAKTTSALIGLDKLYSWPKPSTNQTAEAFFYWLLPAFVFSIVVVVVLFLVNQFRPTKDKVYDGAVDESN